MMRKLFIPTLILAILLSVIAYPLIPIIYAQTTPDTSIQDQRAALEAELAQLQIEIAQKEAVLKQRQQQTGSLKKDVSVLTSQIATAQLKIRQKTIAINNLSQEIKAKAGAIVDLQSEINRSHDSLAELIKHTNELDQKGAAYVLLSAQSVTDFYRDLDDFLSVKQSLYASVNKIKEIKSATEVQKTQLQSKQSQEEDAKNAINSQKKIVEQSEAEKKQLLSISQNKEKEYQAVLAERQKRVGEIKSALFKFAGGSKAIPFGDAYEYAKAASAATGVRAAFILGILKQESNFGANVGTCNRAGDPASKGYRNVMPGPIQKAAGKSSRDDQTIFLEITTELGLDPETTPVSCPAGGGWGGGMGPTQFIPTTWKSIADRVASALGVTTANPWNPRDAIMATGIYLKDRGGVGSEANERNAACRYYSGRSCDGKKPANSFYGNSVMALSRDFQSDIDYLIQYGVSKN